ncbi:MAG: GGDEF domain-containing protein [Lachnospiraceae bacterium]|nr:GGDEF domain-containing protein [Lachnospiraceae bacterium]
MKKLQKFFSEINDLKDKIYYVILFVGSAAILISLITDIIQELGTWAIITTALCLVFIVALLIISLRFHIEKAGKYLVVYFFNVVFFPLTFFACGGVSSGMPLCYLLALFALGLLLDGKARKIAYAICLCVLEASILLSYYYPDKVEVLEYKETIVDVIVTLFITSSAIISILAMILNAYNNERKNSIELLNRLRELSVKDELSGLYNRRELFRRLDNIYHSELGESVPTSKSGCYIAMFDIDNFKSLNDTYGHQFGDRVLTEVAGILKDKTSEENGELAARYGGEEFVCIIRADNQDEAMERVDNMRVGISGIRWEEFPKLVVTISGGLVSCEGYDDVRVVIHDVDSLLYKAKKEGKNQIRI